MTDSQKSLNFPSTAFFMLGCAAITASILYPVFAGFTFWSFLLCLLAGLAVGVPAIAVGSRLDPTQAVARPFWPTKQSTIQFCWDVLLAATYVSVPVILIPTFWLIPAGDSWRLVLVRISVLILYVAAAFGWMKNCGGLLNKWYGGRASHGVINYFANSGTAAQQTPARLSAALQKSWGTLVVGAIAFSIVFGIVDFNAPWLQWDLDGARRFRYWARIMMWCRGNPNSTWSISLLIGVGALGWFTYQITEPWRSSLRT